MRTNFYKSHTLVHGVLIKEHCKQNYRIEMHETFLVYVFVCLFVDRMQLTSKKLINVNTIGTVAKIRSCGSTADARNVVQPRCKGEQRGLHL